MPAQQPPTEQVYTLTEAQIVKLIDTAVAHITAATKAATREAIDKAIAKVTGRPGRKPKGRTRERITQALAAAPMLVGKHPDLAHILSVHAMPKTLLRRKVGNGCKDFDAALQAMVSDGTLITRDAFSTRRHIPMTLYGLP